MSTEQDHDQKRVSIRAVMLLLVDASGIRRNHQIRSAYKAHLQRLLSETI